MPGYYNQNYYNNNYRNNRFNRNYRRNRKYIRKTRGGRSKQLVDGVKNPWIRAGMNAMPYVIKSLGLLKSLINTEPKFVDKTATPSITGTMQYQRLTEIAQGTTDQTRIGNKILLKDIVLRFNAIISSSATTSTIRVVLFVDKETDGAVPVAPYPLQSNTVIAPVNMDASKRFVIIKDWFFTVSISGQQSITSKSYNVFNFHCEFDGTTGAIADARENQIYLGYLGSESVNFPTMNFTSRVKFYDS